MNLDLILELQHRCEQVDSLAVMIHAVNRVQSYGEGWVAIVVFLTYLGSITGDNG